MDNPTTGRRPISKNLRFEVFKRDSFKCQYCGAVAPDVLLHVDHIHPVAAGGTNEITNLITSCEPCNNGKRDILLDDNVAVSKARNQMEALQERREQLELMMEWQRGLRDLAIDEVTEAADFWNSLTPGRVVNEHGESTLRKSIRKFGIGEILKAMSIAADRYLVTGADGNVTADSWETAFKKIGGICQVTKDSIDNPELPELLKIRALLRSRLTNYFIPHQALQWLKNAYGWGVPIPELRDIAYAAYSWTNFGNRIDEAIAHYKKEAEF